MTAVLDGPEPLTPECGRPLQEFEVILCRCCLLAAVAIDSDCSVAALVRVDADDHHGTCLPVVGGTDRSIGISQSGRLHAPLKPGRPVLLVSTGRKTDLSHEGGEMRRASQPTCSE